MTPAAPTSTPAPSSLATPVTNSVFSNILLWAELATEVASAVPSPAQPFAATALMVEQLIGKLVTTHAAIKGQTVAQTVEQLHTLQLIP